MKFKIFNLCFHFNLDSILVFLNHQKFFKNLILKRWTFYKILILQSQAQIISIGLCLNYCVSNYCPLEAAAKLAFVFY